METRLTSAVPFVPHAPARHEATPAREAVRTELSAPQAVTAQVGADQARREKNRDDKPADNPGPGHRNSVTTDRDTGDLVYQVLDPGTRAVLVQTPHESILKLRAYIHKEARHHEARVAEEHHQEQLAEEEDSSKPKPAA